MELQTASSVSAASQARLRLYQQQSLAIARPGYKAKRSRRVLNQSMGFQTNMEDIAALIPNDCSEAANLIHVYKTAPLIGCFDSSDTKLWQRLFNTKRWDHLVPNKLPAYNSSDAYYGDLVVRTFDDASGERKVVYHSPFYTNDPCVAPAAPSVTRQGNIDVKTVVDPHQLCAVAIDIDITELQKHGEIDADFKNRKTKDVNDNLWKTNHGDMPPREFYPDWSATPAKKIRQHFSRETLTARTTVLVQPVEWAGCPGIAIMLTNDKDTYRVKPSDCYFCPFGDLDKDFDAIVTHMQECTFESYDTAFKRLERFQNGDNLPEFTGSLYDKKIKQHYDAEKKKYETYVKKQKAKGAQVDKSKQPTKKKAFQACLIKEASDNIGRVKILLDDEYMERLSNVRYWIQMFPSQYSKRALVLGALLLANERLLDQHQDKMKEMVVRYLRQPENKTAAFREDPRLKDVVVAMNLKQDGNVELIQASNPTRKKAGVAQPKGSDAIGQTDMPDSNRMTKFGTFLSNIFAKHDDSCEYRYSRLAAQIGTFLLWAQREAIFQPLAQSIKKMPPVQHKGWPMPYVNMAIAKGTKRFTKRSFYVSEDLLQIPVKDKTRPFGMFPSDVQTPEQYAENCMMVPNWESRMSYLLAPFLSQSIVGRGTRLKELHRQQCELVGISFKDVANTESADGSELAPANLTWEGCKKWRFKMYKINNPVSFVSYMCSQFEEQSQIIDMHAACAPTDQSWDEVKQDWLDYMQTNNSKGTGKRPAAAKTEATPKPSTRLEPLEMLSQPVDNSDEEQRAEPPAKKPRAPKTQKKSPARKKPAAKQQQSNPELSSDDEDTAAAVAQTVAKTTKGKKSKTAAKPAKRAKPARSAAPATNTKTRAKAKTPKNQEDEQSDDDDFDEPKQQTQSPAKKPRSAKTQKKSPARKKPAAKKKQPDRELSSDDNDDETAQPVAKAATNATKTAKETADQAFSDFELDLPAPDEIGEGDAAQNDDTFVANLHVGINQTAMDKANANGRPTNQFEFDDLDPFDDIEFPEANDFDMAM